MAQLVFQLKPVNGSSEAYVRGVKELTESIRRVALTCAIQKAGEKFRISDFEAAIAQPHQPSITILHHSVELTVMEARLG
jgi:hypothetical protein